MEETCNFEQCKFGKSFFNNRTECFNFVETWWKPLEGQPKLVGDCAPRRTMLMVQDLYNRLIGLQQASEQERNANVHINEFAKVVLSQMIQRAPALKGYDQPMIEEAENGNNHNLSV